MKELSQLLSAVHSVLHPHLDISKPTFKLDGCKTTKLGSCHSQLEIEGVQRKPHVSLIIIYCKKVYKDSFFYIQLEYKIIITDIFKPIFLYCLTNNSFVIDFKIKK